MDLKKTLEKKIIPTLKNSKNSIPEITGCLFSLGGIYSGVSLAESLDFSDERTALLTGSLKLSSFILGKSLGFRYIHRDEFKKNSQKASKKLKDLLTIGASTSLLNFGLSVPIHTLFEKSNKFQEYNILIPMALYTGIGMLTSSLRYIGEFKKGILQQYSLPKIK